MSQANSEQRKYACVILAAGQSKRMAQSKIVLSWGKSTVIGTIISAFQTAKIREIVVVTGGFRELVETEVEKYGVKTVFNPYFTNGEMSLSLKTGLQCISADCVGVFVALGDQPSIDPIDIEGITLTSNEYPQKIIIPSYSMRRGHPWMVPAIYFQEINDLQHPETMKSFIQKHESEIVYYLVKKSNILADLDTPEDYEKLKPKV